MNKPKTVIFDIEIITDAQKLDDMAFRIYEQCTLNANLSTICSFGYQIMGEEPRVINAWDFPNWNENVNDDSEICKAIHGILNDAYYVIGHNLKRFDFPFVQTRMLFNKQDVLPKIDIGDTYLLARSNLKMSHKRLGDLAEALGVEGKMQHEGRSLWTKVKQRDPEAMRTMSEYCKQDVITTGLCFEKLRQFANNMPNQNLFRAEDDETKLCRNCGSDKLYRNGERPSSLGMQQRFKCYTCGKNSQKPKNSSLLR
jgi:DNA polymerase elongation subunit (family B)